MTDIDTSKPNAARIYDYMLGGSHNFEADRAAGEQLRKMVPSVQNVMRLNRWFMHGIVDRLAAEEFSCFLDLASGLPTEGYIHDLVPNAKVLYNDRDSVTVAYARDILGDNPNVRYLHSDISEVEGILEAADEFFQGERRIAVCFVGVAYFLADDILQKALDRLYDWCAPGSQMALSWGLHTTDDPRVNDILALYQRMGSPFYLRSEERIREMLNRWEILPPGLQLLSEWVGVEHWSQADANEQQIGDMCGVIVRKPA
ncbi:MAG TPA: SAM-dependent methyltransferase [Herpetosiphonaceae bacterium]|nr:SAM-dependent methyltransferase [Herpetosiphonaceae bacterium]